MRKEDIYLLPPLVQSFVNYQLTVKNKSQLTVLEYASDLRTFFRFLKQQKHIKDSSVEFNQIDISDIDEDFIKSIKINPDIIDPEDAEMIEDLVTVAVNEAIGNAIKTSEEEMGAITGGLNLPGMF